MRLTIFIIFISISIVGCSADDSPVLPYVEPVRTDNQDVGNNWNWGSWLFYVSADRTSIEAVPLRNADYHYCVTQFMEVDPCPNCLVLGEPHPQGDGSIKLDVTMRHPFPFLPRFTGFDVRGMVYLPPTQNHQTNMEYNSLIYNPGSTGGIFPTLGSKMPLTFSRAEDGGGELLNADGYSCYTIPGVEYHPDWPIFSYQPGEHGIEPTPQLTTVNPYKLFASDLERRMFLLNDVITREYHFQLPEGEFCFGYAVDASWWPPTNLPVTDPAVDFPREANAEDPWWIEYEQLLPICEENVGENIFKITVHHRGCEDTGDYNWKAKIFSWSLSTYYAESHDEQFGKTVNTVIDDFTTEGYLQLHPNWWFLCAELYGEVIPGHHLGVLVVSNSYSPASDPPKTELWPVRGVRFVDIYIEG